MFEVDGAYPPSASGLAALALTQFECFIGANVKKLSRKDIIQLAIQVGNQLVTSLLLWRKHIAIRRLGQFVVSFETQGLVQMAKRLLLRHQLDMIMMGINH